MLFYPTEAIHQRIKVCDIVVIRDATIHNLDVSIYRHLCITIQQYIARYDQV